MGLDTGAEIRAGSLVRSEAGHDKGRLYIVLRVENGFAFAADGKHHGLNAPKKKSLKHIVREEGEADISAMLCDAHVRKAVRRLKTEGGCYLG